MSEHPQYPPIEPTTFDLVVVGTGLPESIIAAAAASASSAKTVLHLDPNPFYGSHFSSLSLPEFSSFLGSNSNTPSPPSSADHHDLYELTTTPLYSDFETHSFSPEVLEQTSTKFSLDVSGPRLLFCADQCVDLMLKSGASQYVEFKSIDASFVAGDDGKLCGVPDSRAAIFKDRSLSLMEKNQLMRFFKLVQAHLAATSSSGADGNENEEEEEEEEEEASAKAISEEDLESPFVHFLTKMRLPTKIKSIILYAIAMVDHDQDSVEVCKDLLKTKEGIDRLALYQSSLSRFTNAVGAFIYPIYGQGELPQAFCRRAAVKGCIYVLRMPVTALLLDKISGSYKGVRLASGQDIFSDKLVLDPSFTVSLPPPSSMDPLHRSLGFLSIRDVKGKVARGICITRSSLKKDISNLLVVYPPQSLYPEQVVSVRVLQINGNLAVCTPGMFILYISALCNEVHEGKKLINAAMNALLTFPDSASTESSLLQSETTEEVKPTLIWSASYIQELNMGQCDSIISTPMPDGNLSYNAIIDATMKLFQEIYPNEEIFPEKTSTEKSEDDGGFTLET